MSTLITNTIKNVAGDIVIAVKYLFSKEGGTVTGEIVADGGISVPATHYEQKMPLAPLVIPNGSSTSAYVKIAHINVGTAYTLGVVTAIHAGGGGIFQYTARVNVGATEGSLSSQACTIKRLTGNTLTTADFKTNAYQSGGRCVLEVYTKKQTFNYGNISVLNLYSRHSDGFVDVPATLKTDDANLNDALTVTIE